VTEPEAKAGNVIEALCRVMRDLPGIGKDMKSGGDGPGPKYNYRGIEQVTPHTQELFSRHGIVFIPHVRSYEVRDLTINNKPWTDVYELVEYTVYGPGGVDDRITVGPILAIGRDNSDKGGNKALTQAFKYALLQALSISDPKDDPDQSTHVADEATRNGSNAVQLNEFIGLWNQLTRKGKQAYERWRHSEGIPKIGDASWEQAEAAIAEVKRIRGEPEVSPVGDDSPDDEGVEPTGDTTEPRP
jgi:ERF superfamily